MKTLAPSLILFFTFHMSFAQFEPNYDERKVPVFELPDLLVTNNGRKIRSSRKWIRKRRPELFTFFENNVFGKVPGKVDNLSFKTIEQDDDVLNGKAKRRQIEVTLTKNGRSLSFGILLYLPKNSDKAPIFLGYNFYGNHTVTKDPKVIVSQAWSMNNKELGVTDNLPMSLSRGMRSHRWPIEKIVDGGFGLATIYYGEIDPDKNDFSDGIHSLFYNDGQQRPDSDEWGSIAAWAFGLSRAMDCLENESGIDASQVIVFGHSRLGKSALWAGATDERFSGVISNDSGCGGAALSKRKFGETLGQINTNFPHWFCDTFKQYNENEEALPIDQHQLLAFIAPRLLYIASAVEDEWADPKGEFLSAFHATPVYDLFGKKGITSNEIPEVNQPIQNTLAYHIRTGIHDVTDFDWEQYIKWAGKHLK